MEGQDWNKVVLSKTKGGGGTRSNKVAPEAAIRAGTSVATEKKYNAGANKKTVDLNMAKLDAETEELTHKKVSQNVAKNIQKARMAKGMTQAQLAQAINEKPQIVNQYESGKAIPNNQIITKIERALGAKVRAKK
eukprot:CAMPEP_0198312254 /NCGR_PEP_ID=MMETSP1450-20131203/3691_1 /TAXON_ID=753684 ORGANISM="Madagascaria erythrocladiodes, Strain CCMP3234" /NCGR_SAMPLE_ID=MMETSP1450 /ASSEMBLY_ACC=CAM_ASM_001115 /LENGTH=134 /DNA_ID=CAMNT_0044015193 /DNA_START=44 /DNA_END=448 /DNA_ORIENTATION=+